MEGVVILPQDDGWIKILLICFVDNLFKLIIIERNLGFLQSIPNLSLSFKGRECVPESIGNLRSLRELKLNNNPLTLDTIVFINNDQHLRRITEFDMAAHDLNVNHANVLKTLFKDGDNYEKILKYVVSSSDTLKGLISKFGSSSLYKDKVLSKKNTWIVFIRCC
jgi:hypothetical protein